MTIEEANKIIAEYMGWKYDGIFDDDLMLCPESGYRESVRFKDSLDALVPVWEKLEIDHIEIYPLLIRAGQITAKVEIQRVVTNDLIGTGGNKSIQHAACMATAKAIKELK